MQRAQDSSSLSPACAAVSVRSSAAAATTTTAALIVLVVRVFHVELGHVKRLVNGLGNGLDFRAEL